MKETKIAKENVKWMMRLYAFVGLVMGIILTHFNGWLFTLFWGIAVIIAWMAFDLVMKKVILK